MSAKFDIGPAMRLPVDDKLAEQIERILRSQVFQGSEILRHLLSYLASCAAANRIEPVKVKEIATVVFGRSADFDFAKRFGGPCPHWETAIETR
jgi:hypothetical protein